MTEALKRAIWRYTDLHADADGFAGTPVAGLGMMRAYGPGRITHVVYKPLLCLVLQGAKEVVFGGRQWQFAAGQSLIVTVDLPAVGRIIRASRAEPYLAVAIELDMAVMRRLMEEMAPRSDPAPQRDAPLFVEDTDEALIDCATRLVRLLDRPEAEPVLRPAIIQEMHYWLLTGPHGGAIRRLAPLDSHAQRIGRAIAVLRAGFTRPLPIEGLAEVAGMSPSSFHQHFKAVTSVSPLQFQKQLRLLEARRLMLTEGRSASQAGFAVGFESASQFTRDYARMFGAPPRRDVTESRAAA